MSKMEMAPDPKVVNNIANLLSNVRNINIKTTSGYAMMVHGWGCNPHRCTITFANLEITAL